MLGFIYQACAGLNGMQLGDKKLVVQRASVGKNPGLVRYHVFIYFAVIVQCNRFADLPLRICISALVDFWWIWQCALAVVMKCYVRQWPSYWYSCHEIYQIYVWAFGYNTMPFAEIPIEITKVTFISLDVLYALHTAIMKYNVHDNVHCTPGLLCTWRLSLVLNLTPVYLKAVAERLKKIQCSAMDNQF